MITANNQPQLSQPQSTAYDKSAGLLGGASDIYKNISEGGILQNINSYLNPYYQQVIDSTFGRMDVNRDKTLGMIGDQAQAAGAFGGSRHGIMEGEFLGQDQMNRAQVAGDLMSRNFDQASSAARSDMFGAAQGATQLGNQYYNIGNNIADRQYQAGGMQQQLMQMLMSGGADQFSKMMQSPNQILDLFSAINTGDPRNNAMTATQQSTPGLFDYLSLGAGMGSAYLGAR
jgi:hypothetical protein